MTLTTTDRARTTGALPPGVVLPPALEGALAACPDLVVPSSREELYRLALGPGGGPRFVVEYDADGTLVPEAEVVRCRNGVAVNYPEDYMRRRDPDCMRIADDLPDLAWAPNLAAMLQVSLVGYAVGGAFLGLAYFDLFYHLVALLAVTRAVVERQPGGGVEETAAPEPVRDLGTQRPIRAHAASEEHPVAARLVDGPERLRRQHVDRGGLERRGHVRAFGLLASADIPPTRSTTAVFSPLNEKS